MTLSSEKCATPDMPADGLQVSWPFDFRLDDTSPPESRLVVTDPTGLPTIVDPGLYTVLGFGIDEGGTIVYPTSGSPLPVGYAARVERAPAFLQPARLRNQGAYPPDTVEFGLDRSTKQTQYLKTIQDRQETRLAAVEGVIDVLGPVPKFPVAPYLTASDLGLAGDRVTDDAPQLQRMANLWSAKGGAVFFLAAPGGGFVLRDQVRLGSGLSVIFASPQLLGKAGQVVIGGELAFTTGHRSVTSAAAAVGATSLPPLDTSLAGGASVSALYPVGSQVSVRGAFGSAGNPAWRQSLKVTAVNDGTRTITFTPALLYAFAAGSTIDLQVTGYLASDAAKDTSKVTLATGQASQFLAGDLVLAQDGKVAGDVAGSSQARVRRQVLRIGGIAADVVSFDRALEIDLQVSKSARLTLIDPAEDSTVQGASAVFLEAPDPAPADPVPTFLIEYASGAFFYDASVRNGDAYGSRGPGCKVRLSIDSAFVNPEVWSPKNVSADGDGDGVVFEHSSDCYAAQPYLYACRRSVVYAGSQRSTAFTPISQGAVSKDIAHAGWGERRCRTIDPRLVGGATAGSGTRQAITFGDETVCGGSSWCSVEGGNIAHYNGSGQGLGWQGLGIVFVPGTDNCGIRGTRLFDVEIASQILDVPSLPSLVCVNPRIDVEVDTAASYLGYYNGHQRNPSASYTITGLEVRMRARNIGKMFHAEKVSGLTFQQLNLDAITVDATESYVCRFVDVPNLVYTNGFCRGAARGLSVQTCPGFVVDNNEWYGLTVGELLLDLGGSDGGIWGYNPFFGFTATYTPTGGSALGYVRTPGVRTLADQTALKIKPTRVNGKIYFDWGPGTAVGQITYQAGASPASFKINGGATVDASTSVLTGTTGTAGHITISAAADGYLYFENRSGGTLSGFEWENIL